MTQRIFNFSAGPAVLPVPVLEEARENLLSLGKTGVGVMEHSHRGKAFIKVLEETEAACRNLGGISDNYKVLFLGGGASTQFFMVPMNLLGKTDTADYLVTGAWSEKAVSDAKRYGNVHIACTSKDRNYNYIPDKATWSDKPVYAHYTSNNTIFGTQFKTDPTPPGNTPLICDMSSDMFCRPVDVSKYGLIYAGAQKNLGPAGVTLVIVRDDLIKKGAVDIPAMLQYRTHAENDSCYNTPPCFPIYVMGLVFKWIESTGGLAAMQKRNEDKAGKLYTYFEQSKLFKATAVPSARSLMNVTFVTGNPELDDKFVAFTKERGMDGLKGHRSVGGMRASIYNAFPAEGVDALVTAMKEFEAANV